MLLYYTTGQSGNFMYCFQINKNVSPSFTFTMLPQAMEFLSKLLDNKIVTVQMKRPTSPTLFLVHCRLSDSGINVADELVAKGFAKVRALQVMLPFVGAL